MPADIRIKSDLLAPLSALNNIQQGPNSYYRHLRLSSDAYTSVGAWCALLDGKLVVRPFWDEIISLSRYPAIRQRAFEYFKSAHDREYADKAARTEIAISGDLQQKAMIADLEARPEEATEAEAELYLSTGDINHLRVASEQADAAWGWREALAWAIRAFLIAPLNPAPMRRLYTIFESASQPDLVEEFAAILSSRNLHPQVGLILSALVALDRKDAAGCLKRLAPLDDAKIAANPAIAPYLGAVRDLRAKAEEKLGNYRAAYEAYVKLNAAERDPNVDPEHYYKGVAIRSKLAIPAILPPDTHPGVIQMLGFPRSGTTLLENILNAHPQVETFEEIPALTVAIDRIERVVLGKAIDESHEATFLAARQRYYREIEVRRRKPGAAVLIDKMPIRSAETDFIVKLFPEWRYIFSIRHPFDVVLSCFKQRFVANPAMENFRTIAGSIRLYDFTMNEWFKHHTMDDPAVIYVRYDELVTDFERVSREVFDFLHLPWDEAVRDFAKASENRAANTPSYAKVRQGLGIGVQSQWRNYDFLFNTAEAAPLRKWAKFFGYETE